MAGTGADDEAEWGARASRADAHDEPLQIPHEELSPDALRGLVEAFVLREGTEYGDHDVPLETKVMQVMRQLDRGEARVIFDPESEVVDIVTEQSLRRARPR